MNLPRQVPWVYGFAYLLWANASGEWALGILLALALEMPRLLKRRVEVDARAYRMVWLMALLLEWILAINGWLEGGRDRIDAHGLEMDAGGPGSVGHRVGLGHPTGYTRFLALVAAPQPFLAPDHGRGGAGGSAD
jgi:hypothetical protein